MKPEAVTPLGLVVHKRPTTREKSVFLRQNDYWIICYDDHVALLKSTRGLCCLAVLLSHPGLEFHVRQLLRARQRDAIGDGIGTSAELGLHTDGTFPRFGFLRGDKLVCLQCPSLELPPTVISRSNSNWNQETADVSCLLEAMTDSRFRAELDCSDNTSTEIGPYDPPAAPEARDSSRHR